MSHNYSYRQPRSDLDYRPNPPTYSSADDEGFYQQPQESFSSSYLSSSSSFSASRSGVPLQPALNSADGIPALLSSCGLQHEDLDLLTKLPEDVLNIDSLPHILQQIKDDRGEVTPFPPTSSSSSYPPSSTHQTSFFSSDWDQPCSHPVQYPLQSTTTSSAPLLDRWGNPMTVGTVRSAPSSSSSSSRHLVDYDHRPHPPNYGKTGPVPSYSPAGPATRVPTSHLSDPRPAEYGSAAPLNQNQSSLWESGPSSSTSASTRTTRAFSSVPYRNQALDFLGKSPKVYPHSCSLCSITVLSERVWIQHINGTIHADGQLVLLQDFPDWDCRLESAIRNDVQSGRWNNKDRPAARARTRENQAALPSDKNVNGRKTLEKGKVVCAKFPVQSLDEAYLRKLVEPFGKIVKILMFPSLAYVELGSNDQANDLVKFHSNYPPIVKGEKIEFSISKTFKFLQSCQVLSFTPAPTGHDGRLDLISIIKRFGTPLYTLFLPSKAFVEMKSSADAHKVIHYYTSSTLRINKDRITVAFSSEYKTLMRVPSAKKYEEEQFSTQRTTSSRDHKDRTRSKSRDWSRKEKRSRSRSRDRSREKQETRRKTGARSRSRERSARDQRSRAWSRSKDMSSSDRGTRTREDSSNSSSRPNRSAEKLEDPQKPATETRAAGENDEAADEDCLQDKEGLSAEESDIEGMEVIAEDGEDIKDEEAANGDEQEEGNMKTDDQEKAGMQEEVKGEEMEGTQEDEDNEDEAGFPLDLENCITLDEVVTDEQDDEDPDEESESSRVLYFNAMPLRFTDDELLKTMKGFGTVVRYLLIQNRRQAFVEMSTHSEALKTARQLKSRSVSLNGCRLHGTLSRKYTRLTNGWEVRSDKRKRSEERDSWRQSRTSTSDMEETSRRSKGRKESSSKKTDETELTRSTEIRKTSRSPDKRKGGSENDPPPQKSRRTEPEEKRTKEQKPSDSREQKDGSEPEPKGSTSPDPPQQVERQNGDSTEAQRPAKAVGSEFVRPVVGYFCNLCQLIFIDEDEAKVGHCSTLEHYRKYQEKTGNDPWTV